MQCKALFIGLQSSFKCNALFIGLQSNWNAMLFLSVFKVTGNALSQVEKNLKGSIMPKASFSAAE